ncbi:hypothetical protein F5Y18DRAFT_431867 [Xylariaceae sp. FL1019]|nr:hypothetical protein F5Y18DRAFT_431867 [Xylariaceae sp. FL1019]
MAEISVSIQDYQELKPNSQDLQRPMSTRLRASCEDRGRESGKSQIQTLTPLHHDTAEFLPDQHRHDLNVRGHLPSRHRREHTQRHTLADIPGVITTVKVRPEPEPRGADRCHHPRAVRPRRFRPLRPRLLACLSCCLPKPSNRSRVNKAYLNSLRMKTTMLKRKIIQELGHQYRHLFDVLSHPPPLKLNESCVIKSPRLRRKMRSDSPIATASLDTAARTLPAAASIFDNLGPKP